MGRYIRFLVAGLPAALLAVPLNVALVEWAGWPKPWAYAFVLLIQLSLNYCFCRWFVFEVPPKSSEVSTLSGFVLVVGFFRLLDWASYTFFVDRLEIWYGWLQVMNLMLFSFAKYFACKYWMQARPQAYAHDHQTK